jgi:hypothetical protein
MRGQQSDRGGAINKEWKLNTPEKVKLSAPKLEALLTQEEYQIYFFD